jgi:site-specific DNA recombinase
LISLSDDMPHCDGFEYVFEALVHWKDQQYLQQLSRDTKRGLHLLARQGYAPGGFPPRGYKADHLEAEIAGKKRRVARWVPDPEWAPRVQEAWRMRADGASYQEIIDKTGIHSSRNSLTTHFRNKTYLGYRVCGDIEVPNAHEPLVSQELWDAVQQTLYKRPKAGASWGQAPHPRRHNSRHLLSGFVRCAYCGAALIGRTCNTGRHKDWRYYICGTKNRKGWDSCSNRTIPARHLESAVVQAVMGRLLAPDFVMSLVDEVNNTLNGPESTSQIPQLQSRIKILDRRIMRLVDLAEEVRDTAEVASRLKQRKEERQKLRQELRLLESTHQTIEVPRHIVEEILAEMRDPLANGTLEAQRTVLRSTVERIVVEKNRAELYYQFPCATLYKVPPARLERAHTASEAAALSA